MPHSDPAASAAYKAAWDRANPDRKRARQKKYNAIRRPLKRIQQRIASKTARYNDLLAMLGATSND